LKTIKNFGNHRGGRDAETLRAAHSLNEVQGALRREMFFSRTRGHLRIANNPPPCS
jgi:hypothetical protein